MLNSLYTATSGLTMQQRRMDVISSNLANLNTVGHKRETAVFSQYIANPSEHPDDIIRNSDYNKMINTTVRLDGIHTDFQEGYLKQTGRNLDMAFSNPKAFFAVDTPFGVRFTRDGQFTLNNNNELVTMDGYKVLSNVDNLQPVRLQDGSTITEDGDIMLNGARVGGLDVVQFEDTSKLQKVGENLYAAVDTLPDAVNNPGIQTGYLEGSNVNPVQEMVKMIETSRGFESYSKVIQTIQEIDDKAVNQVGSIA